ncbi:hypothetical protein [Pseudoroseomonas sp. WGS1072]|uniref:hypothetical protein n=1 Tax=Roseomonas sp. WGS1072 TaxID=3366816 RepID=UPI003BF35150
MPKSSPRTLPALHGVGGVNGQRSSNQMGKPAPQNMQTKKPLRQVLSQEQKSKLSKPLVKKRLKQALLKSKASNADTGASADRFAHLRGVRLPWLAQAAEPDRQVPRHAAMKGGNPFKAGNVRYSSAEAAAAAILRAGAKARARGG